VDGAPTFLAAARLASCTLSPTVSAVSSVRCCRRGRAKGQGVEGRF
jgi:hypothetical protein